MKAIVKASGETVEVFQYGKHHFLEYIGEKTGRLFLAEELDLLDNDLDYWTRLEHTYAGMAMQVLMTDPALINVYREDGKIAMKSFVEAVADICYDLAHSLVEKMKQKEDK